MDAIRAYSLKPGNEYVLISRWSYNGSMERYFLSPYTGEGMITKGKLPSRNYHEVYAHGIYRLDKVVDISPLPFGELEVVVMLTEARGVKKKCS